MTKASYSNITVYAPLQSSYGFLPASKWPDFMPSLIWTAMTDRGTRVVTWEGARFDRDVAQPVSFQAEFHDNGEVTYRYDTFPTNGVATGVSGNLRLWDGDSQIGAGGVSDGGSLRVEGIATNAADETSHISYAVLDKNGETITTITRKFVVTQSVSFIFDSASTTDDGAVVVVKRSTDPVRINNSSFSVETAGIASGAYRLVSDKTKFHLNNMTSLAASLPSGSSANYEIYGDTPSSSMFDAELSLETVEGTTLCTTNITVLWVEISIRCGQDDVLSDDNVPGIATNSIRLGKQKLAGLHVLVTNVPNTQASIGNVVELKGAVYPSDFIHGIGMARDCISESQRNFTTNGVCVFSSIVANEARGPEGVGNDQTRFFFQDRDPRPNGYVYDIDTPGFIQASLRAKPMGIIFNATYNFLQYAFFKGRRCSDDFPWFSKTSVTKEDQDGYIELIFNVDPDDFSINSCGGGHVPIQ